MELLTQHPEYWLMVKLNPYLQQMQKEKQVSQQQLTIKQYQ